MSDERGRQQQRFRGLEPVLRGEAREERGAGGGDQERRPPAEEADPQAQGEKQQADQARKYLPRHAGNTKEKEKELKIAHFAERKASSLIDEMEKRYEKDIELYQKKQLACKKLSFLEELAK